MRSFQWADVDGHLIDVMTSDAGDAATVRVSDGVSTVRVTLTSDAVAEIVALLAPGLFD